MIYQGESDKSLVVVLDVAACMTFAQHILGTLDVGPGFKKLKRL